jgi:hypothetical protein
MNHSIAVVKLMRGLPNDTTQLQDMTLTEIIGETKDTKNLTEVNGLKYKLEGDNFTKLDFYKDFPPIEILRNIIQDQVGFDVYGQMYLDSLRLNIPFYPDIFKNQLAEFEQSISFNTRKLSITWIGISKINEKQCAVLHFQSMYSPIDIDNDARLLHGRSCFWGNIWISLNTREIEYATMYEDLISKMKFKTNGYELQINMQREVKLEKIK